MISDPLYMNLEESLGLDLLLWMTSLSDFQVCLIVIIVPFKIQLVVIKFTAIRNRMV